MRSAVSPWRKASRTDGSDTGTKALPPSRAGAALRPRTTRSLGREPRGSWRPRPWPGRCLSCRSAVITAGVQTARSPLALPKCSGAYVRGCARCAACRFGGPWPLQTQIRRTRSDTQDNRDRAPLHASRPGNPVIPQINYLILRHRPWSCDTKSTARASREAAVHTDDSRDVTPVTFLTAWFTKRRTSC
jgi:hypothetical protein